MTTLHPAPPVHVLRGSLMVNQVMPSENPMVKQVVVAQTAVE
ncbi:hypothetical protein [Kocuria sp.]|nr:hypothetical protein [Kocuria sp.]MDO5618630.1 hypothetical protein [Kocuria sp.]